MGCDTLASRLGAVAVGVFLVVAVVIGLLASSFRKLDSRDVALKYDTFNKVLHKEPHQEGLYSGAPGFDFIVFSSVFSTLTYHSLHCINGDGVPISLSISFQYRDRQSDLYRIVTQFRHSDGYDKVLYYVGVAAILDSCCMFNTSQFQSERGIFQQHLTNRLIDRFDAYSCEVTDVQVNNIGRPWQYENAVQGKESNREDIEVAKSEGPKRVTKAHTKRIEALTGAQIIINDANTNARINLNNAQAEADGILNEFHQEAHTYKRVMHHNNLDTEGFLAYMGVRVISNAKNTVNVGIKAPAKTSYVP